MDQDRAEEFANQAQEIATGTSAGYGKALSLKPRTLVQQTQDRINSLEEEVVRQKELLQLLRDNPQVERIFSLLSRGKNY